MELLIPQNFKQKTRNITRKYELIKKIKEFLKKT